jgi:hypothetical protein
VHSSARSFIVLCAAAVCFSATAQPAANFHIILLAGQSNMAGRGKVAAADKVEHRRVKKLSKAGEWVPAVDPVHYDKKMAGVGLGRSFALTLAEADPKITIGLVPSACGGSPISTWTPGGYHGQTKSNPYDDAIARCRKAQKNGVLKAILWHQGESDGSAKSSGTYEKKLTQLIKRFRKDLNAPDVPFIIGQLGKFEKRPWNEHRTTVDAAHQAVAKRMKNVYFVSSDGLTPMSDNAHFNAESLRDFGKRYAKIYLEATKK